MDVNPWIALVCCPLAVENLSAGRAKKARNAMECPSSTRRRGWSVMGITGASVAETDSGLAGDLAAALILGGRVSRRACGTGKGPVW